MISACDKGGRLDKALEVYHDMETAGLEADLITFSNLVSGTHVCVVSTSRIQRWSVYVWQRGHDRLADAS